MIIYDNGEATVVATEVTFQKYIVVVMGSSRSGISQFINYISELAPQTVPDPNPSDTLKPLDYGRLTVDDNHVIYLYGLSEENPLSAWTFLFDRDDPVGIITLVDSTRPDSFSIGKTLIKHIDGEFPYLVAANKQDCANAWELDAIRVALNLRPSVPMIPCSAVNGMAMQTVISTILDMMVTFDEEVYA